MERRNDKAIEGARRHAKLRILVVEDEQICAAALARMIEAQGYEVRTAPDFRAAIRQASSWLPDVLLCDIGLPGKDGLDVMREMRRVHPALKGLTVSGMTCDDDLVSRSRRAGFAGHIPKPVDFETLAKRLRELTTVM